MMRISNRSFWTISFALIAVVAIACSGVELIRPEDPTSEALLSTVAAVIDPAPSATVAPAETPPNPTAVPAPGDPTATVPTATSGPAPTQTPPPSVSAAGTSGNAPLTVQFNVSDAPNIDSVTWDFGDGVVSTELSPEHTFTIAGTHTVQLTVTDSNGQQIFAQSTTVEVSPGGVAAIAISPDNPTVAVLSAVQFSATAEDQFGNPVELAPQWSLNGVDGQINTNDAFTAATVAGTFNDAIVVSSGNVTSSISLTGDPGPVATLVLDQSDIDLVVQESLTIGVTARDEFGNQIANPTIAWNVAGDAGSVDSDGVFIAGTRAGEFGSVISVNVASGSRVVTAGASLIVRPGELARVDVSPTQATILAGAMHIFTASGTDAHGNEIADLAFAWSATGGEISQIGLFKPAGGSGQFEISAAATIGGFNVAGVATVGVPPAFDTFQDDSGISLWGDAVRRNGQISLTPSPGEQAGVIWSWQPVEAGFETSFV